MDDLDASGSDPKFISCISTITYETTIRFLEASSKTINLLEGEDESCINSYAADYR